MEDPVRHANHRFRNRVLTMEESTLRWPTDKECDEMEEVCSTAEVPHTERAVSDFETRLNLWAKESDQ